MLQSMGLQRVEHNIATEQQQQQYYIIIFLILFFKLPPSVTISQGIQWN